METFPNFCQRWQYLKHPGHHAPSYPLGHPGHPGHLPPPHPGAQSHYRQRLEPVIVAAVQLVEEGLHHVAVALPHDLQLGPDAA